MTNGRTQFAQNQLPWGPPWSAVNFNLGAACKTLLSSTVAAAPLPKTILSANFFRHGKNSKRRVFEVLVVGAACGSCGNFSGVKCIGLLWLPSGEGVAMTIVLIFGAVAGVILGLGRFKVLALLPVIVIVAAGVIGNGLASGLELRIIAFGVLMAVVCPQIGYLVSSLAAGYIVAEYLQVRATSRVPASLHAMQTEIGQQLRTELELPRQLPREMVALLAEMDERERSRSDQSGRAHLVNH